jgi:SAM-dependent methyltransferase
MLVLNLGCGTRTSPNPHVINVDWSIYLRIRRNRLLRMAAPIFVRGERRERYEQLPDNILVHDLSKGIPFPTASIDVVYHSHLLEHLDRDVARTFMREVFRVLRSGGIHRIVVPDFELVSRAYLAHIQLAQDDVDQARAHDTYIAEIIEQLVRSEGYGTARQGPLRRRIENALLGDARKRGEAHRWMYDRISLRVLLEDSGFRSICVCSAETSRIPNWPAYSLDTNADGSVYKPRSLYMEALK